MNEQDKKYLGLIAQALEPNAVISRNGYFQIEVALEHLAKRLKDLSDLEYKPSTKQEHPVRKVADY